MSTVHLNLQQLVTFHGETVSRETAFNYVDLLENARTPFIIVEKRRDKKFNVIGGFKYVDGIRLLQKEQKFLCLAVNSFPTEKSRKIATLQRCLEHNEKLIYKEILIYELTKKYHMHEYLISKELGIDAKKIKRYMYNQIIPKTYLENANILGVKNFVQAIYLNKRYSEFEKQILTELILQPTENLRFKKKHLPIYNQYRKDYSLFDDFHEAKLQVYNAIQIEGAKKDYWSTIPHPSIYWEEGSLLFNDAQSAH